MKKYTVTFIAFLLFVAGLVMHYLTKHADSSVDVELIGFFSGFCAGAGAGIFFHSLVVNIKSGKKETEE